MYFRSFNPRSTFRVSSIYLQIYQIVQFFLGNLFTMNKRVFCLKFIIYFFTKIGSIVCAIICPNDGLKHPSRYICDDFSDPCPQKWTCIEGSACCISFDDLQLIDADRYTEPLTVQPSTKKSKTPYNIGGHSPPSASPTKLPYNIGHSTITTKAAENRKSTSTKRSTLPYKLKHSSDNSTANLIDPFQSSSSSIHLTTIPTFESFVPSTETFVVASSTLTTPSNRPKPYSFYRLKNSDIQDEDLRNFLHLDSTTTPVNLSTTTTTKLPYKTRTTQSIKTSKPTTPRTTKTNKFFPTTKQAFIDRIIHANRAPVVNNNNSNESKVIKIAGFGLNVDNNFATESKLSNDNFNLFDVETDPPLLRTSRTNIDEIHPEKSAKETFLILKSPNQSTSDRQSQFVTTPSGHVNLITIKINRQGKLITDQSAIINQQGLINNQSQSIFSTTTSFSNRSVKQNSTTTPSFQTTPKVDKNLLLLAQTPSTVNRQTTAKSTSVGDKLFVLAEKQNKISTKKPVENKTNSTMYDAYLLLRSNWRKTSNVSYGTMFGSVSRSLATLPVKSEDRDYVARLAGYNGKPGFCPKKKLPDGRWKINMDDSNGSIVRVLQCQHDLQCPSEQKCCPVWGVWGIIDGLVCMDSAI